MDSRKPASTSEPKGVPVLILTSSFPRWDGDYSGAFIEDSSRALLKYGISPSILCPSDSTGSDYHPPNIPVERFRYFIPPGIQRVAYRGGIRHNLHDPVSLIQFPLFIARFISCSIKSSRHKKILHANWIFPGGLAGAVTKALTEKPLVMTLRGSDVNLVRHRKILRIIARGIASRADALICVSKQLKSDVLSWGIPPHKVHSFPDGIDPIEEGDYKCWNTIIFVGRLASEKRVEDLIDAYASLAMDTAELVIAGDGPLYKDLFERAERAGPTSRIRFLGRVPRHSVPGLISQAGLFVLPSSSEGLPDSLLTAMACGTTVVATRLPGIKEVAEDGITALLVNPSSPDEISKALGFLMTHTVFSKKLGRRARFSVRRRFPRGKMIERLVWVYEKVATFKIPCPRESHPLPGSEDLNQEGSPQVLSRVGRRSTNVIESSPL